MRFYIALLAICSSCAHHIKSKMTFVFRTHLRNKIIQSGCVAAIGNFDGVHRGHQYLLARLKEQSTYFNLPMLVVLFEPQPGEFFSPHSAPVRLYSLREKIYALKEYGVDVIYCLRFNQELSRMSPEDFAHDLLFNQLKIKCLYIGEDFRFGKNRLGNAAVLKQQSKAWLATVKVSPTLT